MPRFIFHLSIPVSELPAAKSFYVDVLGAAVGRETAEWLDVLLWGHQVTLQLEPERVSSLDEQGKRHFGVVLPWGEWEQFAERLKDDASVISGPSVKYPGESSEQGKLYLKDPSNNIIEIKAYKDFRAVLGNLDAAAGG